MNIEKEKRKVIIVCQDGLALSGFIFINPGERISDFLNDLRRNFIVVSKVEFANSDSPLFAKLKIKSKAKRELIILNKSAIKWLEEI
jgi:hypothetical protein